MLEYRNLNDYEFEQLCFDIMQRKLNTQLHTFGKGRDGGIDITDDVEKKNIVIQVKHYIDSSFSSLISCLKKEVEKVNYIKPKQYYICCAQTLTPNNVLQIYKMFSDYMESSNNIITLTEINDFLQCSQNVDILRKHYKLWLSSTNILNEIYNQNIFIDCESLLYDARNEQKYFVKTQYYDQCKRILDKDGIVMIVGLPGTGKTVTTKMLALNYANQDYRVRYTTNGEISDLKKAISANKEMKEIIILDDCLGQCYFNLTETKESELISLIKYIYMNSNKKLIMNSRITIYNEAKKASIDFEGITKNRPFNIVNMNALTELEKAHILYNHLYFSEVPQDYYGKIKENKYYKTIVNHRNYVPRIIEYISTKTNYEHYSPENYVDFINESLNNPNQIWHNEYYRRLNNVDRIFLTTLYSLTDTLVEEDILRRAFNYRIMNTLGIDNSINHFDEVCSRLNKSMIALVLKDNKKMIRVINPSVNDFLKNVLSNNENERMNIVRFCTEFIQIKRISESSFDEYVLSGRALELNYNSEIEKSCYILDVVCKYKIKSEQYLELIKLFINNIDRYTVLTVRKMEILIILLSNELNEYYHILDMVEPEKIKEFLSHLDIIDFGIFFTKCKEYQVDYFIQELKEDVFESLVYIVNCEFDSNPGERYFGNYDSVDLTNKSLYYSGIDEFDIDYRLFEENLMQCVHEDLCNEIRNALSDAPEEFIVSIEILMRDLEPELGEWQEYFFGYEEEDYDDIYVGSSIDELDYIFK